MAVAIGAKLARHQTVKLARAGRGQNLFMVKAWHRDDRRRRWVTVAYRHTRHEAEVYARGAAFHLGDRSVAIFYKGKNLKQWKGAVAMTCPNCQARVQVPLERAAPGGR